MKKLLAHSLQFGQIREHLRIKVGFSLMEILIVGLVLAIVAVVVIALFNPKKQIERVWDGKRRNELAALQKTFDDFYNDKSTFPISSQICYDAVQQQDGTCSCRICGRESASPAFAPYLNKTPCDPQHPGRNYLYQYDCATATPSWYRVCAYISEDAPAGLAYNWGVASQNVDVAACNIAAPTGAPTPPGGATATPTPPLPPTATPTPTTPPGGPTATPTPTPTPGGPTSTPTPTPNTCPADPTAKFCYIAGICNNCGNYGNCNNVCDNPSQLYETGDASGCQVPCVP